MPLGIVGEDVAALAWGKMKTQRVCLSGEWNSNGGNGGYGHLYGMQRSLIDATKGNIKNFGCLPICMASTVSSTRAINNNGNGGHNPGSWMTVCGYDRAFGIENNGGWLDPATRVDVWGAESGGLKNFYENGKALNGQGGGEWDPYRRPVLWRGGAGMATPYRAGGLDFSADQANTNKPQRQNAWTCDFWYGATGANVGSFRPGAYHSPSGSATAIVSAAQTNIAVGAQNAMARLTLDVPAGTRQNAMRIQWGMPFVGHTPTGDVFLGYMCAWETSALTGYMPCPYFALGGNSTQDFAYRRTRTDTAVANVRALDHHFDVITRPAIAAGQEPFCIWVICDVKNTSSETDVSVWTGQSGASVGAWVENIEAIIADVTAGWIRKGFKEENLVFAIDTEHPHFTGAIKTIEDTYRTTGVDTLIARHPTRLFAFRGDQVWTVGELTTGNGVTSYYANPTTDGAHMSQVGYEAWWDRMIPIWASCKRSPTGGSTKGSRLTSSRLS